MILKKDYDELEAWIYHVSGKHDFNTEVFKIGETEEGRNIVGLHVGDKNHSSDKPKIFIECGIHAREWIAPAACRQFIHEILHNVGYPAEYNQAAADDQSAENERAGDPYTKEDVISLMDFNWYIILQMNPDGYQYSRLLYLHELLVVRPINRISLLSNLVVNQSCITMHRPGSRCFELRESRMNEV